MQQYSFQQRSAFFHTPRITWAVQMLILLNTAIFALQLLAFPVEQWLGNPWFQLDLWLGFQPASFLQGWIWTPFTYQFLHGGLLHLFMNMLWLFIFGPDVERLLGSRQFLIFYVACGALGVLATLLPYLAGKPVNPLIIGASGSALGVIVAFAMIDPQRQFFLFPLPVPVTAVWLVILVVIFNLLTLRSGQGGISVATHFGGMLAGGVLMKLIPRYHSWRRRRR
ncbi:MAG: rhomboid family intramembrane serine protease [Candidatus Hydrogenedens sp.]|jgi:membrane associated rhomboid family serine protease|nr:rhomboid family intramembrane serine protease [Candidatus Hydrogenedens sp.]